MNLSHQTLEEAVKAFVAEMRAMDARSLTATTSLFHNLGLDGADALEFMDAFAEKFKVDLSAFEFSRHFGPEGAFDPIGRLLYWLWRLLRGKPSPKFIPVTVQDLVNAAAAGRWQVRAGS